MVNNIIVEPAILEQDSLEIQRKINLVKGLCSTVHLDIMDGEFVANATFKDASVIAGLDWGDLTVTLHLMINNPILFLKKWAFPQVATIIIHYEASSNLKEEIKMIKLLGKRAGVAINPHTPTYAVTEFLNNIDTVMLMGVEPGYSTQAFNADVLQKIAYIHSLKADLPIIVDGGVNNTTKAAMIAAGATILCANSFIFKSNNIKESINILQA